MKTQILSSFICGLSKSVQHVIIIFYIQVKIMNFNNRFEFLTNGQFLHEIELKQILREISMKFLPSNYINNFQQTFPLQLMYFKVLVTLNLNRCSCSKSIDIGYPLSVLGHRYCYCFLCWKPTNRIKDKLGARREEPSHLSFFLPYIFSSVNFVELDRRVRPM